MMYPSGMCHPYTKGELSVFNNMEGGTDKESITGEGGTIFFIDGGLENEIEGIPSSRCVGILEEGFGVDLYCPGTRRQDILLVSDIDNACIIL